MISPTAIVDSKAILGEGVEIGHYAVIGPNVVVGDHTRIGHHTVIEGPTRIGTRNRISHHVVMGTAPQDLKYQDEPTELEIGDENIIREFATIHRGTIGGHQVTRVGNKNMVMAYAHIAHDCRVGNEVILANAVNMAGHVEIDDYAIIGGMCAIHQFVHIGRFAFIGGGTAVAQDVIPFGLVAGSRGTLHGINTIGLRRRGFDQDKRHAIHTAVRYLLSSELNLSTAVDKIRNEFGGVAEIDQMLEFIGSSQRGILLK